MNRNEQPTTTPFPVNHPVLWAATEPAISSAEASRLQRSGPAKSSGKPKRPLVNRLEGPERDRLLLGTPLVRPLYRSPDS